MAENNNRGETHENADISFESPIFAAADRRALRKAGGRRKFARWQSLVRQNEALGEEPRLEGERLASG